MIPVPGTAPPTGAVARAVAVSASAQFIARAADLLVNVATSLAVLRYLGAVRFGDFVLVVTVTGLAGLLADAGLPKLAVREVARNPSTAGPVIGTVTVIRLVLSVVSLAVAQAALAAMGASEEVHLAALLATTTVVAESLLSVTVIFHVAIRQQNEAAVRLAANVVKLILVAVLMSRDAGLLALVTATTAHLLVASALAWVVSTRSCGLRPSFDRSIVRPLLQGALPMAPIMLLGVIYLKLGLLMVGLLAARHTLGIYGAAYQPIEYLFLVSAVIVGVLFPLVARAYATDHEQFVHVYQVGVDVIVAAMLPVSIGLMIVAHPLVRLMYGDDFAGAGAPMLLLALALVPMTVNAWQGFALVAAGRAATVVRYLAVALAMQITLDLVLVPRLSAVGAAWAALASSVLLLSMSTRTVARAESARPRVSRLARLGGANASFALLLGVPILLDAQWVAALAVAVLAYPAMLLAFKVTSVADVRSALRRQTFDETPLAVTGVTT